MDSDRHNLLELDSSKCRSSASPSANHLLHDLCSITDISRPFQIETMHKAALEAGRLSPVFDRKEDNYLGKMEGLNPERARRLMGPRSPSMPLHNSVGPRKTGSNTVALGKPATHKPKSLKQECFPSSTLSLARISKPVPSVTTGAKRPRDHLDEPQETHLRRGRSSPPIFPPRK